MKFRRLTCAALGLITFYAMAEEASSDSYGAIVKVTDRVLNKVSPLVFGENVEWTNGGEHTWLREENKPDPKVIEELRAAGVTHLRYPGGTLSDYFDWYKAVGQNRQPIPNPWKRGETELPAFGPDEFMTLCTTLGVPGTITLNAGTGTPQDAVVWAKYYHARGFTVTCYTLGNELYLNKNNENIPETPIYKTPEEYAQFYLAVRDAIKSFAPDIPVGIVGYHPTDIAGEMAANMNMDVDWNKELLPLVGDKIDFMDLHNCYAPSLRTHGAGPDAKRYPDDDFARCFLASSVFVQSDMEVAKKDLEKHTPNGGKNIRIHVSEYGPIVMVFEAESNPEQAMEDIAWNRNLIAALYQACLFNVLLSEPKVDNANHMPIIADVFGGLLRFQGNDRDTWRNVIYFVFQMYSKMAGRQVLAVDVEAPTYSTHAMGFIPALDKVPCLDVSAYRSEAGDKLTLFLVNRDLARSAAVTIQPGMEDCAIESITRLTADSYKADNTPENREAVVPANEEVLPILSNGAFDVTVPRHSLARIDIVIRASES